MSELAAIREERRLGGLIARLRLEDVAAEIALTAARQYLNFSATDAPRPAHGGAIDRPALEATLERLEAGERELTPTEAGVLGQAIGALLDFNRDYVAEVLAEQGEQLLAEDVLVVLRGAFRAFAENPRARPSR